MGGKNSEIMESMSIVSTTNLLNKMLDFLKTKDSAASEIAQKLLDKLDMATLAKSTILVSTSDPASKKFLFAQARYLDHLRKWKHPKPSLTRKRKTQLLVAFLEALRAYFASWDYIQKATLLDGMSKMPTTFVPEEFRQFIEDIQKEK